MKNALRTRRAKIQRLENRQMMAGDVSLDINTSGSRLDIELTGDHAGNGVEIRQISNDLMRISGTFRDGAATTINGRSSVVIPMTWANGTRTARLDAAGCPNKLHALHGGYRPGLLERPLAFEI